MGRATERALALTDRVAVDQEKGPGQGKVWKYQPRYTIQELLSEEPPAEEDDEDIPDEFLSLPAAML